MMGQGGIREPAGEAEHRGQFSAGGLTFRQYL